MVHGAIGSAEEWTYQFYSGEMPLPYRLALEGNDVWIASNRGSLDYSSHSSLTRDDKDFYNYTWADMGSKDLPAFIDLILAETGSSQVKYIGYSRGTL